MTQIEQARAGKITEEMKLSAERENVDPEAVRRGIEDGTIIVLRNRSHSGILPLAIGRGLKTKVNANIGTSKDNAVAGAEIEKLLAALRAGADTVMDLSTGGDLAAMRKAVMRESTAPVGTVPIYQAAAGILERGKAIVEMDAEDIFRVIEENGEDGVDFITVHCGVTLASVNSIHAEGRLLGIVSRGGAMTAHWMDYNKRENPLFSDFGRLLEIARRHEMVLSLGDGLRPGCIADATDRGQVHELLLLGELAKRARQQGVQVMIEGPGHVPFADIAANVLLQKQLCDGAPFYVLGPLPTDIAPGHDHITAAIGGAVAGAAGADFLCYVTPSEHLRLPTVEDVRDGVISSRIAAHIADIARGVPHALAKDISMAEARKSFDWEAQIRSAIDPEKAEKMLEKSTSAEGEGCTMCGDLCAIRMGKK
ncbi:MAG TPA: phosphomethylpyrimidine synthase ThiC [Syntrophales bacterium]|nr:phosphomethylpyrimidine synthase ThiC [Syntrophales bacterium]